MSDTKTADDLVYEVAGILGIAVVGEALGNIEYSTINQNIDQVLAEIENIIYIGDRNEIPSRYFLTIARLVAVHSAAKFSNSAVDLSVVEQHENRLRYLTAPIPTRRTLQIDPALLPYRWRRI